MADTEGLLTRYRSLSPELLKLCTSGKRVLVVTHIDADGLASGSIVFTSLMRKGGNVTLRTVPDLDPKTIRALADQKFDYYIFTDLASTLVSELEAIIDGRFLTIDHHQLSKEDMPKPSVVNAWTYGFDGGTEACSSAMAYFFASSLDPSNTDLSPLAVVGAVADRQDQGPGRSLTGLNRAAMEEAQSAGLLGVSKDLMFTGRETRPVHEAVALTSTPFMRGVTGSKDAVLAALHQSGLQLKDGGTWRTISSLSSDEKMKLTEVIAGMLGSAEGATDAIAGLVGEVYTLSFEDSFTPLRDAREFGTLLNACGRMGSAGTGVAVCLGDRTDSLKAAMRTLVEYRSGLNKALDDLAGEPARTVQRPNFVFVNGEGLVDERILGPVISILTSSPGLKDKVVVGCASSGDSELKISSRVGDFYAGHVNLALVMHDAADSVNGVGGGHTMAAGAKIPVGMAEAFLRAVDERTAQC
ncbi:MAG: DHH family phosphoesterase [Thaumarchaeota archaeon]|nr:DHH family phosphoesterase [Nitrososphaerota archaeon]